MSGRVTVLNASPDLCRLEQMVREFHTVFGYKVDSTLDAEVAASARDKQADFATRETLLAMARLLLCYAAQIKDLAVERMTDGDTRLYRVHLMMEELGEAVLGMAEGDEVKTADGLTDLLYVLVGSFITFSLPIMPLAEAVHVSNMTKRRKDGDVRLRDKGPDFKPPDIKGVLEQYRKDQQLCHVLHEKKPRLSCSATTCTGSS